MNFRVLPSTILFPLLVATSAAQSARVISGEVLAERGEVVSEAVLLLDCGDRSEQTSTDSKGKFRAQMVCSEDLRLGVQGVNISPNSRVVSPRESWSDLKINVRHTIPIVRESLVITATALEPSIDRRNDTIYKETLFNRDDQLLDTLASGINAGQHEGGGKSIEVRRFGFNLDHGGVSGGLKILVDDIQQNQATQGHGQGYLGQLKSLSPELVDEVEIINGPFNAEYGDFSGLGVVHIRTKERLADRYTVRIQGGSFGALRSFLAWSPRTDHTDSVLAYEFSKTDGPFVSPLHYRRDNLTGSTTRHLDSQQSVGFKFSAARNVFDSSGQIPLDRVWAGALDRYGYVDRDDGGSNRSGMLGAYYRRDYASGDTLRADAFVARSLFDLWSNFTFYLNDPLHGDEIRQHDSRLQQGGNVQWLHSRTLFGRPSLFTAGANVHANQINVGLDHTESRQVLEQVTSAHANVSNEAWYAQQSIDLPHRVHASAGLRFDLFQFDLRDQLTRDSRDASSGTLQPKANISWTPLARTTLTLHASYGRGISSQDARGIAQYPNGPKVSTTDFSELGASSNGKRWSAAADMFLIDRSNEQVYVPDDGSVEFKGPSRSYGWEAKTSVHLTSLLTLNTGVTQVSNAFYRGTSPRVYVGNAPHTVADAALTLSGWRGFFSSVRYRHINRYLLDDAPSSIRATGADVLDVAVTKRLRHGIELNAAFDNLTNDRYWETQNYFESRLTPSSPAEWRVHATPGYPVGLTAGVTFRFE